MGGGRQGRNLRKSLTSCSQGAGKAWPHYILFKLCRISSRLNAKESPMMLRRTALTVAVSLLTACATSQPRSDSSSPPETAAAALTPAVALQQLFADYWEESLALSPLRATYVGDARYNNQLPNYLSEEERTKALAFSQRWRAKVAAIDLAPLGEQDRLSVMILLRDLDQDIESARFPDYLQPINQIGRAHV
jgi:hypothetical protein